MYIHLCFAIICLYLYTHAVNFFSVHALYSLAGVFLVSGRSECCGCGMPPVLWLEWWRGRRGSSRRFILRIDSGKKRGQSSHSCWHWMFSARSLCQIPMHVVAGEMRSADTVWFLHMSSKWHTLCMGAFPLNCGPMNLEVGGSRDVWIRLALENRSFSLLIPLLRGQWMSSRCTPCFSWIGATAKIQNCFTYKLQNCACFPVVT